MTRRAAVVFLAAVFFSAAARAAPSPSVAALQAGRFDEAEALAKKDASASGHLVAAIARYKRAAHQLSVELRALVNLAFSSHRGGGIDWRRLRAALAAFESELYTVDADLAAAARDPAVALELCPACWSVDWNQSGAVDDSDRRLLEVEVDAAGEPIPDGDPRRRPTFRFDAGDVSWARAMVAFQHAAVSLLLAFRWSDLDPWLVGDAKGRLKVIAIHLDDAGRVTLAKKKILDGLAWAERARTQYLAETDDDREWVPSPRQKQHPLPLPVDDALYRNWAGVIADLRRLANGEEGLAFAELGKMAQSPAAPRGFLSLGALLAHPKDLAISIDAVDALEPIGPRTEPALRELFGAGYVASMKSSPLPARLLRMKSEIARGEETLAHKLRYLFWLN